MAPNSWLSLDLAPGIRDALKICIKQVQGSSPVFLDEMSDEGMHMTLVFFGSNLRGFTPSRRAELDEILNTFHTNNTTSRVSTLEFEALELFPPSKRNLLIAKYRISGQDLDALRKLQIGCFELGLVSENEHDKSQGTDFVAHITLGKFRGMKANQSSLVDKAIADVNATLTPEFKRTLALPFQSAYLCGG